MRRRRSDGVFEDLIEQRGRLRLPARRRDLGLLVFMFRVAASATRPSDFIVDHRDYRVIGDAALARTIVVQHVAGPIPAVLHATPLRNPAGFPPSRASTAVLQLRRARTVDRELRETVEGYVECGKRHTWGAGHPKYIKRLSRGQARPWFPPARRQRPPDGSIAAFSSP